MEYQLGRRLSELPGPLLITGHTGFKGTWMTILLEHLNVPVVGYSLPAEKDSLYAAAERTGAIPETFADIRNYEKLEQFINLHKPSSIIHMAAQPLVLESYENPRETFDVNVMGTVNVLDLAFKKDFIKAIIVVTTDKVYKNDNSGRAFVETDPLEGKDPYSASKVGAETVIAAWQQIARVSGGPKVISARAGNVIGGGDFAKNRIIPDVVRAMKSNKSLTIRNGQSTRPWQHVLDPIVGYLRLNEHALSKDNLEALNFGSNTNSTLNVEEVVRRFLAEFPEKVRPKVVISTKEDIEQNIMEARALSLDATKSWTTIGWSSLWDPEISIQKTALWWRSVLIEKVSVKNAIENDIKEFLRFLENSSVTEKLKP